MIKTGLVIAAGCLVAALGACESVSNVFAEKKTPPDEFAVYSEPPLSMPPDYRLRPPRPGESRPQTSTPRFQAERAMLGAGGTPPVLQAPPRGSSPGVEALLRETGALAADPNIREIVNRESSLVATGDRGLTDRLMFWRGGDKDDAVIDPVREAERIRGRMEEGRPVTGGAPKGE